MRPEQTGRNFKAHTMEFGFTVVGTKGLGKEHCHISTEIHFLTLKIFKAIKVKFPLFAKAFMRTLISWTFQITPKVSMAMSSVKSSLRARTLYYLFFFGFLGHGI